MNPEEDDSGHGNQSQETEAVEKAAESVEPGSKPADGMDHGDETQRDSSDTMESLPTADESKESSLNEADAAKPEVHSFSTKIRRRRPHLNRCSKIAF